MTDNGAIRIEQRPEDKAETVTIASMQPEKSLIGDSYAQGWASAKDMHSMSATQQGPKESLEIGDEPISVDTSLRGNVQGTPECISAMWSKGNKHHPIPARAQKISQYIRQSTCARNMRPEMATAVMAGRATTDKPKTETKKKWSPMTSYRGSPLTRRCNRRRCKLKQLD